MSLRVAPRKRIASYPGRTALIVAALSICFLLSGFAAENEPPLPALPPVQDTNSADLLRANLQLQEQLHGLQLSIEENRKQAEAAAQRNADAVANRLQTLEQTMAAERARDLDAVRGSNRMTVVVASSFAVIGVLVMLLMAYQWRTVSRLAEASAGLPTKQLLAAGSALPALLDGDNRLIPGSGAEQSNSRLLSAMDRLEKRIHELEHVGHAPSTGLLASANHTESVTSVSASDNESAAAQSPNGARIGVLLGKGQSLLNLDKAEEALACFEEALALEPSHTDALLKKASALERLRKLPEAVECYDRAIAADGSLTIAYLYKGGLFNRMERFEEALDCYEHALKAQEKR